MYAVDGISHVLPRGHDQAERDQHHHRYGIMQAKYRGIDLNVIDFDQVLQASKNIEHVFSGLSRNPFNFSVTVC